MNERLISKIKGIFTLEWYVSFLPNCRIKHLVRDDHESGRKYRYIIFKDVVSCFRVMSYYTERELMSAKELSYDMVGKDILIYSNDWRAR